MRLAVLGILTTVFILCVTTLATVLALAAILAGMGDAPAATVLRYIGLGIGALLVVDATVLFLYLIFLIATTELALSRASETEEASPGQTARTAGEDENLPESDWEEGTN